MQTYSLNGQWTVSNESRGISIPATVPGDVHADLLNAGEILDPFFRDNERDLQWIGERDWAYSRTFLVSGVEDRDAGTVEIHLTSDRLVSRVATVSWSVTNPHGTLLAHGQESVQTPSNGSRIVRTIKLQSLLAAEGAHNVLVWLEAEIDGEPRQRSLVLFAPPKDLELSQDPGIEPCFTRNPDDSFAIDLTAEKVALWIWLELQGQDADISDNFFHLRPGRIVRIVIRPAQKLTEHQLRTALRVRSLVDTYSWKERTR